uniref:Uncharacterized protein n=1 Tax=Anguilla anguilla TaxID=7936 RepID=A0A0E9QWW6_ANGAN
MWSVQSAKCKSVKTQLKKRAYSSQNITPCVQDKAVLYHIKDEIQY